MMKSTKLIDSAIPSIGGMLLVVVVSLILIQIILRDFFNYGFYWSDEVSQFLMSWLIFSGSIWVTKNNQHLNTEFKLHKKLNERQIKLIDGILALLIAGTAALVTYQSAIFAIAGMKVESLTLPWIKKGYIHIALPLFMMSVCYYYLKSFFKNIAFIFKKK